MADVLKNPRVQDLLRAIGQAQELATRLGPSPDLDGEVSRLHRDLGRAVAQFAAVHASHTMIPPDDGQPLVTQDLYTNDESTEDDDSWYTNDVSSSPGPLFEPGGIEDGVTEVPEADGPRAPLSDEGTGYDDSFEVENVARMQFRRDDPDSSMAQLTADPAPTWLHHVEQFRELLQLPADFDDPKELAVEASRVQWATGELETRLDGMPAEIQVCFVGLLAARCQLLANRLDVTVGPRLSLDRLSRYRLNADLPSVAGLEATARPEYGAWVNDVRQWWAVLTPGPI